MGPDPEVVRIVELAAVQYQDPELVVRAIEKSLLRINDIEILNNEGDGACVYPNWP